ncbi:protocadherin Fat 1-like isoform X2 [Physella acuta]|uniref:protocadherin Fat 1-like isoform X2 n=1 Tax=Physella acuta TaxID=109671 RepID=UPI0027DD5D60|nr:protocadherin Fat 1-like isoform X2 [Physella acuta]
MVSNKNIADTPAVTEEAASYTVFSPSSVTIPATTKTLYKLNSKVNCVPASLSDICTCLVDVNNGPFATFWLNTDDGYYVYYDASVNLTPGTTYPVRVTCKESNNNVINRRTLNVIASSNTAPTFSPTSATVTVTATSTPQYSNIYTVAYTDADGDAILFSSSSTPSSGYFTVGAADGTVRTAIDLQAATTLSHKVSISATDSFNTVNSAFVLYVEIVGFNTAPDMTSLPATVSLSEDATAGRIIVNLGVTDDSGSSLTPVCTSGSSADDSKFTYDQLSGSLVVAYNGAFDYETKSSYTITCTVTDGYLSSTKILNLIVANVNEIPKFDKTEYFCQLDEGTAGSSSCQLNAVITDPEDGTPRSVYFLATNNGNRFSYVSDTVTMTTSYDLDQAGLPTDTVVYLAAVDSGGLTSTATVKIHVNDINDNSCRTDSLKLYQLDSSSILKKLGAFSQSDSDVTSPNNQVHFELTSATPSSATDHIYVTRNGAIFYSNIFSASDEGQKFTVTVQCVDEGSPRTTSTATVLVYYAETTTTTTTTLATTTTTTSTTAATRDIWDYPEFRALFGAFMAFLGLLLLLALTYLCWKYLSHCKTYRPPHTPARKVEPYREPSPRRPPALTHRPAITSNWDNMAWSLKGGHGTLGKAHYFHYH